MKLVTLILAASFLVGCRSDSVLELADQTIEYQVNNNQYAVIVVQDEISKEESKKYAMQQAAETAKKNGYRYFKIESEGEVAIAKSDKQFPGERSQPRNLYYEMIQSGNFGRERISPEETPSSGMYQGYRVIFSCYKEPPSGKSEDVCEYTTCK